MHKRNKLKFVAIEICFMTLYLFISEKVYAFNYDDYIKLQDTNECNQCNLIGLNLDIAMLILNSTHHV